jgi:SH3-like domain-containing protein
VAFVYTRAGLPVEITAESDNWRRIRDWEGSEGWVYHSLLSGKRTALLAPKDKTQLVPLYDRSDSNGTVIAQLQAGVLAQVKHCSADWCRISGPRFDGWVVQEQLWGVYANETFP